jgi:RNA polymerase sigma-70 factor, ECF subfamily
VIGKSMDSFASDEEILRALRAGDQHAFDRFFAEYLPRLYRFVLPRVQNDRDKADELCQQVLSRAMCKLGSYRGEAMLFTWLCQIARNEISDYWRRRKREEQVMVFVEDDETVRAALESLEVDITDRPEQQHSRAEVARLVQVALDSLPTRYGDALEWKYVDGFSVAEIADRLGQTVLATQSMLARARGAFRDAFEALTGASSADLGRSAP